jgi:prepilin-type N-terminal cleavage/methylation domain-containing protein
MRRPGLTLLELVIVLTILAVLLAVAVQSLDGVIDQGRYDGTRRTLSEVRAALVGTINPDANLSGFVTDIGRPPTTLAELLTFAAPATSYPLDTDGDGVADDTLVTGWRGPYLHLTTPGLAVRDGWGNPLAYTNVLGTLALRSAGPDGVLNTADDVVESDVVPNDYAGTLTVNVQELVSGTPVPPTVGVGETLRLRMFASINGVATLTTTNLTSPAYGQSVTVPQGVRVVRAVLVNSSNAIVKRSNLVHVRVAARSSLVQTLYLGSN